MTIKFYKTKEPYGFMSNFYRSRMFFNGRWWNWSEAPYQAAKTNVPEEIDRVAAAAKPSEVRLVGQEITMRSDWDQVKYQVMKDVCIAKFLQHPDLRRQLIETGTEELIEDSPVDYYWGCGKDGTGQNMLGKVLMEIRTELQGE